MSSDVPRKVGRGGAGNFYTKQEVEDATKRTAEDLEAQKSSTTSADQESSRVIQEYAHTGRGGAGNWISPRELQEKGTFADTDDDATPVNRGVEAGRRYQGRGGAGNYEYATVSEGNQGLENEKRSKELHSQLSDHVAQDVEAALAQPAPAHLGQSGVE